MSEPSIVELFDPFAQHARSVLEKVADAGDVEALLTESREAFERLAPEIPYTDRRDHLMWEPTLSVFQWLAVHLACRERGIDAHRLGGAMLDAGVPEGSGSPTEMTDALAARALRPMVIARKLTQGTRGPKGQRQVERLWSVIETARQQNVPVFAFLARALDAHLKKAQAPVLVL